MCRFELMGLVVESSLERAYDIYRDVDELDEHRSAGYGATTCAGNSPSHPYIHASVQLVI
jgi:hypothetical protein